MLRDFYKLLDIAVNEYLLVVALDGTRDEHLLTYDSPLHVSKSGAGISWLNHGFRANNRGYLIHYRGRIPASLRSYHLVFDVEPGINIEQMYLTTDADRSMVEEISADLLTLAGKIGGARPAGHDGSTRNMLELETQTTLRRLAELVRRRRWDASHAGFSLDDALLPATADLCWAATAGEVLRPEGGSANGSILVHRAVRADRLAQAAEEIKHLNLAEDLSLENDPTPSRAHVYWRRQNTRNTADDHLDLRAGLILRDTTAAGPRSVSWYAAAVAAVTHCVASFMTKRWWPYDLAGANALWDIQDRGAIIAVLLLVPGFLYTRLALPDRHSITGYLRAVPRLAALVCIISMAILAACIAAGVAGTGLMIALFMAFALSTVSAVVIILPEWLALAKKCLRRQRTTDERLRMIGAPDWVRHGRTKRRRAARPDVIFSSGRSS